MAAATRGIKVMMGSGVDGSTYPHGTQALDFEWLVKRAGLTPARAIQSGTTINAEALGWQDQIGSIDKGKFADMIAVSGDPLADIRILEDGRDLKHHRLGGGNQQHDFGREIADLQGFAFRKRARFAEDHRKRLHKQGR